MRAKIVCFSGGGATKARPNFSAYAASKTAVVRLVETLAQEWVDDPVDINVIAPGALSTRMTEEILELGTAAGEAEVTAARKVLFEGDEDFERVGGLVDFLLSPKSDGVTGKLLSAKWDPWHSLHKHKTDLESMDIYTLRRIVPEDRGKKW
jgi:3-oxoacyl-[acyl-carrier protein] reductase